MKIAVPRETASGERRVALVPAGVSQLIKKAADGDDLEIVVECGAGTPAGFPDEEYEAAGAKIAESAEKAYWEANLVLKVDAPSVEEAGMIRDGAAVVSFVYPPRRLDVVERLRERGITSLAMESVPRITRAQSMDALSSQSTIAGYKAVLLAAVASGKMMPMMVTAAGTLAPAKVLVLGAGVAGLQAIATARRLGAVVLAFDVRPAVKEQVESLGARFVAPPELDQSAEDKGGYARELSDDAQQRNIETVRDAAKAVDVVITTALIPGKPAPVLLPEETVQAMKLGAVIVDLAAEMGGNCPLTEAGAEVVRHGVTIIGPLGLPSSAATHASEMFSKNVVTFVQHVMTSTASAAGKENGEAADGRTAGGLVIDLDDEIVGAMCITHAGEVRHAPTRELLEKR